MRTAIGVFAAGTCVLAAACSTGGAKSKSYGSTASAPADSVSAVASVSIATAASPVAPTAGAIATVSNSGGGAASATPAGGAPVADGGAGSGQPQPPSSFESTIAADLSSPDANAPGVSPDIGGGDANATPHIVATVPPVDPVAGQTPAVDPSDIAPPNPPGAELAIFIDANASADGIQATRHVHPGDTFRVGVVIANAPGYANNGGGGISALNFELDYDKTKIVAPSISGGPSVDRNPDLNVAALGGVAANWACLPAPEGDLDDPGGITGDNNPATGQAFLSCFTPGTGRQFGTVVVAVVTFHAIAPGTVSLSLSNTAFGNPDSILFAQCSGDYIVPCNGATIIVD